MDLTKTLKTKFSYTAGAKTLPDQKPQFLLLIMQQRHKQQTRSKSLADDRHQACHFFSISLILYTSCLGLSLILVNIHSLNVSQPKIAKNLLKTRYI